MNTRIELDGIIAAKGLALGTARVVYSAKIDVETEPLPPESELYTLPNVIFSPHCADKTVAAERRVADLVVDNVQRFIAGQPLRNLTDKQAGY